jgi:hypothetical protein
MADLQAGGPAAVAAGSFCMLNVGFFTAPARGVSLDG